MKYFTLIKGTLLHGQSVSRNRFYTIKGDVVPLTALFNLPRSILSTVLFKCFEIIPIHPWFSYRAANIIKNILPKKSTILEFGSGMSTLWFAKNFESVVSIEHDIQCYERVSNLLKNYRLTNVDYRLTDERLYPGILSDLANGFDFILIDGIERETCVKKSKQLIKKGGYIMLDNSDVTYGDYKKAVELLTYFAGNQKNITRIIDFVPCQVQAQECMLVRVESG